MRDGDPAARCRRWRRGSPTSATCSFPGRGREAEPWRGASASPDWSTWCASTSRRRSARWRRSRALDRHFAARGPLVNRLHRRAHPALVPARRPAAARAGAARRRRACRAPEDGSRANSARRRASAVDRGPARAAGRPMSAAARPRTRVGDRRPGDRRPELLRSDFVADAESWAAAATIDDFRDGALSSAQICLDG